MPSLASSIDAIASLVNAVEILLILLGSVSAADDNFTMCVSNIVTKEYQRMYSLHAGWTQPSDLLHEATTSVGYTSES